LAPGARGPGPAESAYWRNFRFPTTLTLHGAVQCVSVSPVGPHDVAVSAGARVSLFGGESFALQAALSDFAGPAFGASFRSDGRLLAAGTDAGGVRVYAIETKSALRVLRGHKGAVRVPRFAVDRAHLFTAADDGTACVFDLADERPVARFVGHDDYVRAGATIAAQPDLWVTGSYDHTVCLWDARAAAAGATAVFDADAPVDAVLPFANGSAVLSAAGNRVRVWDLVAGRLLHEFSNHQKPITALAFSADGAKLLSGGLDHLVKVYEIGSYRVLHSYKVDAPVLSLAVSPDGSKLIAGMTDGTLSVRKQARKPVAADPGSGAAAALANRRRHFDSYFGGMAPAGQSHGEIKVTRSKWRADKLAAFDQRLKRFDYGGALDAALLTRDTRVIYSMLYELWNQNALKLALAGRGEVALAPLLDYLLANVSNVYFAEHLVRVANYVMDLCAATLAASESLLDSAAQAARCALCASRAARGHACSYGRFGAAAALFGRFARRREVMQQKCSFFFFFFFFNYFL
jgi:U3 small nucleolar RNA-associated protein 15